MVVASLDGVDLRSATRAWLRFTSEFDRATGTGDVQVRVNGGAWIPLALADAEANWRVGEVGVEVE